MNRIKILIVATLMLMLMGCTSPKVNEENQNKNNDEDYKENIEENQNKGNTEDYKENAEENPGKGDTEDYTGNTEENQNGETENISGDEDSLSTNNEILNEVKTNIDKAHEVGKNVDILEADKYIDDAMELLEQYLSDNDADSKDIDFIDNISGIRVSEYSEYTLFEYSKSDYQYGYGRLGNYTSWKVIKYKPYNLVDIFEKNGPLLLSLEHRLVTVDGNPMLFIYGKGRWEGSREVVINAYKIEENGVTKVQPIKYDSDDEGLWICKESGSIRTKPVDALGGFYIKFKSISEDAKEVEISARETLDVDTTTHILELNLNENGQYEF